MALTETLQNGLDRYGIGPKVRELRVSKRMGLVELGAHTGLSAALLSKIERGRMYPTLPTLLRIALVFSVGLDYFFRHDEPAVTVVRRADRVRLPERMGSGDIAYHFESLDFRAEKRRMNSYLGEFEARPVEDVRLHKHDGAEFVYVLEGTLGLYVRDGEETLAVGDAAYLDATVLHGYRRVSAEPCRALVVTVP
ncbi:MAG: XRE family transcriptional regulator [Acidobacteria bacterium]|nr:XRE family transcriptional regulator [Acidobacteriota bacterium]